MKKIIGLSCLIGLSGPVATYANHQGSNPVSKEWVISTLTMQAADWQALCPAGVSITSGCLPNCQSGDNVTRAACKKVLKFTGLQNLAGVTVDNPTGLYVISLKPNANSNISGPYINNTNSQSAITCAMFSQDGVFVPPTIAVTNGSVTTMVSTPPLSFDPLGAGTNSGYYGAYDATLVNTYSLFSSQEIPLNTTYYLMCLGIPSIGNVATNSDVTGVGAIWS